MQVTRWAGVLAMVSLLSGCWLQIGGGPGHANLNALEDELTLANVADLEFQWRSYGVGIGSSSARALRTELETPHEPMVLGGRVYLADREGFCTDYDPETGWCFASETQSGVTARDTETGELLWRSLVSERWEVMDSQPVVFVDGELWFSWYGSSSDGRCNGAIHRLDAQTGESLGTIFNGFASSAVQFGDKVAWTGHSLDPSGSCEPASPERLMVWDLETQEMLWTAPVDTPSLPAVISGKILVNGTAYRAAGCAAATCDPLWSAAVDDPIRRQVGSADGHIFVTSGTGASATLSSLDPATGDVLWSAPTADPTTNHERGVAVVNGFIYVASVDRGPTALEVFPVDGCNSSTCDPLWTARFPELRNPSN